MTRTLRGRVTVIAAAIDFGVRLIPRRHALVQAALIAHHDLDAVL